MIVETPGLEAQSKSLDHRAQCARLAPSAWMYHDDGAPVTVNDFLTNPFGARAFVGYGMTADEAAALHANGKVAGALLGHALSEADAEDYGRRGVDWLIPDELMWHLYLDCSGHETFDPALPGDATCRTQASAEGAARYNALAAAARRGRPSARVAAVEPYFDLLEGMLQAGGRPDMVMGEDYAGDVGVPQLARLRDRYGLLVGQWIQGARNIETFSAAGAELIVLADWDEQPLGHQKYYDEVVRACAAPAMFIDGPSANALVARTVDVVGWALDQAAPNGAGVDAIHVWAYPNPGSGQQPFFAGAGTYGSARPDVAAAFGPNHLNCGYHVSATLDPTLASTFDLVVSAHSTVTNSFNNAKVVRVTIPASRPVMYVDAPAPKAEVSSSGFLVGGWAVDLAAPYGPGVDWIDVWVNASPGGWTYLGPAAIAAARPDVGGAFGSAQFSSSGFNLWVPTLAPGSYDLYVAARSSLTGTFNDARLFPIVVR